MSEKTLTITGDVARSMLESFAESHERNPDENGPPSVCDFACHLGIMVEDALEIAKIAVANEACTRRLSDPGFIFKKK